MFAENPDFMVVWSEDTLRMFEKVCKTYGYQAVGLEHHCALFSYENLENGTLSLYGDTISGLTIYRGWMMKPDMYRKFFRY